MSGPNSRFSLTPSLSNCSRVSNDNARTSFLQSLDTRLRRFKGVVDKNMHTLFFLRGRRIERIHERRAAKTRQRRDKDALEAHGSIERLALFRQRFSQNFEQQTPET
jgi:hypothetical protein